MDPISLEYLSKNFETYLEKLKKNKSFIAFHDRFHKVFETIKTNQSTGEKLFVFIETTSSDNKPKKSQVFSTVLEIYERFKNDVDMFSGLSRNARTSDLSLLSLALFIWGATNGCYLKCKSNNKNTKCKISGEAFWTQDVGFTCCGVRVDRDFTHQLDLDSKKYTTTLSDCEILRVTKWSPDYWEQTDYDKMMAMRMIYKPHDTETVS